MLTSRAVNDGAKLAILKRASAYAPHGGAAGLSELARLAIRFEVTIGYAEVSQMANSRVPAEHVLTLLQPSISEATTEQILAVLRALGGDYQN